MTKVQFPKLVLIQGVFFFLFCMFYIDAYNSFPRLILDILFFYWLSLPVQIVWALDKLDVFTHKRAINQNSGEKENGDNQSMEESK